MGPTSSSGALHYISCKAVEQRSKPDPTYFNWAHVLPQLWRPAAPATRRPAGSLPTCPRFALWLVQIDCSNDQNVPDSSLTCRMAQKQQALFAASVGEAIVVQFQAYARQAVVSVFGAERPRISLAQVIGPHHFLSFSAPHHPCPPVPAIPAGPRRQCRRRGLRQAAAGPAGRRTGRQAPASDAAAGLPLTGGGVQLRALNAAAIETSTLPLPCMCAGCSGARWGFCDGAAAGLALRHADGAGAAQ